MANTAQHIKARNDPDLLDRLVASAEQQGVENAAAWVMSRVGKLVAQDVSGGQTVSDVHAYADQVREAYIQATPTRPGADLTIVTDAFLVTAIQSVIADETPPE